MENVNYAKCAVELRHNAERWRSMAAEEELVACNASDEQLAEFGLERPHRRAARYRLAAEQAELAAIGFERVPHQRAACD